MSSLLFIPVILCLNQPLSVSWRPAQGAAMLGLASAVAQAIGLLRWVLVVPGLARSYADPSASDATRNAIILVFDAVHHFGGMVWMLGQTELLHIVVPSIPSIEVIPIAFIGWEAWLAILAGALLVGAWRGNDIPMTSA